MPAERDFHLALLVICLLKTISSMPTTSQPLEVEPAATLTLHGSPTESFIYVSEDYSDLDPVVTTSVPLIPTHGGRDLKRCDYKPCLENQLSCNELWIATECLCPGFTSNTVPPEAPNLGSVSLNGSDVIVKWCEPLSYVTEYVVTLGGKENRRFGKDKRSGSIGQVDNVIQVCVIAVNDAGESGASCTMYQPKDRSVPLKAGLIGGALLLLAVVLLVVLVWRRRQKKQEAHISSAL